MKRDLHLSSPHVHGDDVAYAQHLLLHGRFDLDVHVGEEGIYDKKTATAVKRAKYLLGYKKPDEVFGDALELFLRKEYPKKPLTLPMRLRRRKRLRAEKAAADIGARALAVAKTYIGHKEFPSGTNNCSPFTTWYGTIGVPWCAEFVSYCLSKVGFKHVDPRSARWAYCPYMVNDARNHRNGLLAISHAQVRAGDIVLYDWNNDGVADHVGFFEEWTTQSTFHAIEGNTAIGNDSNGGEVMRRSRSLSDVVQFVRVVSS